MKIHPAADIFPMMSEEELADLAEDIKENGLLHPIVLDADKQLIDGRNRYAACKLAGVQPRFEQLNGRDPLAFIASANLQRRNLTKGQQAMAMAKIYPVAERGRGKKDAAKKDEETSPFTYRRLQQARQVLAHSAALADEVLKGTTSLDAALKLANEEKQRAEGDEARLDRLSRVAPDLHELVTEGRMTLDEATAAWTERETRRRQAYQAGVSSAERVMTVFGGHVAAIISGNEAKDESEQPIKLDAEHFRTIATAFSLLEDFFRKDQK